MHREVIPIRRRHARCNFLASEGFEPWRLRNPPIPKYKMTSSNENIVCVTGPLCWEFTGHRLIPRSFDVFFDLCLNKQSCGWWFETPSRPLWLTIMRLNVADGFSVMVLHLFPSSLLSTSTHISFISMNVLQRTGKAVFLGLLHGHNTKIKLKFVTVLLRFYANN